MLIDDLDYAALPVELGTAPFTTARVAVLFLLDDRVDALGRALAHRVGKPFVAENGRRCVLRHAGRAGYGIGGKKGPRLWRFEPAPELAASTSADPNEVAL